ncbi:MAG: acetyl-CoA carboxylase biotin carboxyl carrier protein [Candidatus Aminicenantes bacterium]|nr:acetyl-CoA carboxylase biotin carboxyl carrier protein [Candidatus Aminicenantes bacterium]
MKGKIDYEEIIKLIDLFEEKKLTRFELEVEGFKIKIGKEAQTAAIPVSSVSPAVQEEIFSSSGAPVPPPKAGADNLHIITSPMVGTFYRSPDPSSPPFVEIGDKVKKNQTLCIVEAMKLMNEIESDIDGVVEDIFIQNGKPVEYGQKLFAVKPAE